MIFQFETEEDMEAIRSMGNFDIFGSSLILCHLPEDFRLDFTPKFKFRVWVTLPNLSLPFWNPSALGKIASLIGDPIEVDYKTISNNSIAGPRFQVLVDALKQPIISVNLRLHNGSTFEQKVTYTFYSLFCSNCKRVGHSTVNYRVNVMPNQGVANPARDGSKVVNDVS